MSLQGHAPESTATGFVLGGWLVQPSLGRLSSGRKTVHLEPRAMDLLVFLSEHAGEVVSRNVLVDEIWEGRFISDATLTAAVGALRRDLEDDARYPRFIETVPKRGYRLVANVLGVSDGPSTRAGPIEIEKRPYPGLSAYEEQDHELFFGRESEVEGLWEKLGRHSLLALIGPSGSGKTSFLRAGVVPARPDGWGVVICTPGRSPHASLAEALLDELIGDTDAIMELLHFDEIGRALTALGHWQRQHREVLLVVDQFEEMFTLHSSEERAGFVSLLGRAVAELGVHVLLSMRDDFFFRCHENPELKEVFTEVTPLAPLSCAALRRALKSPAEALGYRFEDEGLVDTILAEVEAERGALPLMAFTAARLWELRDRETHCLTRSAFEEVGGLGGALGQYAESVLTEIGAEHLSTVRELFRNLGTAQGTRSVRDQQELLSVFDSLEEAEGVLQALVRARLLTSFESGSALRSDRPQPRVEIIHESLLTAWPRLMRWRAQYQEGAVLRDQLLQTARLWEDRGRPDDLLWTDTSYREFVIWQERYRGGLSDTEAAFARAMAEQDQQQTRHHRRFVMATIAFLLVVVVVVAGLWRQAAGAREKSEGDRIRAEAALLEAEAANLLSRAQLQKESSLKLAYALASLELRDARETRSFVGQTLSESPPEMRLPEAVTRMAFSPDGEWFAIFFEDREAELWPLDGGEPHRIEDSGHCAPKAIDNSRVLWFSARSELLGAVCWVPSSAAEPRREFRIWSVDSGRTIAVIDPTGLGDWSEASFCGFDSTGDFLTLTRIEEVGERTVYSLARMPIDDPVGPAVFGSYRAPGTVAASKLDTRDCSTVVYTPDGYQIHLVSVDHADRLVATQEEKIVALAISLEHQRIATIDSQDEIRIWSTSYSDRPLASFTGGEAGLAGWLDAFSPDGSMLIANGFEGSSKLWDLDAPPDAEPIVLGTEMTWRVVFSPDGQRLIFQYANHFGIRSLRRRVPRVFRSSSRTKVFGLAFDPIGSRLFSAQWVGSVLEWPLKAESGARVQTAFLQSDLLEGTGSRFHRLALDPTGRLLAAGGFVTTRTDPEMAYGAILISPDQRSKPRALAASEAGDLVGDKMTWDVAFDPEGRRVAAGMYFRPWVELWDVETGETSRIEIDEPPRTKASIIPMIRSLGFTPEGRLLVSTLSGQLWRLDPETGESERSLEGIGSFGLSRDGQRLLSCFDGKLVFHDRRSGTSRSLASHGEGCTDAALDPTGTIAISAGGPASPGGTAAIRVGPVTGEEPHLLLGHTGQIWALAVSSDGSQIATADEEGTIILWPMPDVSRPALHALPLDELLAGIRSFTNAEIVRDEMAPEGYRVERVPITRWPAEPIW